MAYMLYDGGGQGAQQDYFYQASGTVPKSKLNWEEFKKDLAKRVRVQKVAVAPTVPKNKEKEAEVEDDEETCLVCTDKLKDRCILKRLCRCENFPCEGHACSCKDFSVCFGCVGKALWQGTNSVMKQKGRYRAKCPLCKAEYCARDILRLVPATS
ncbi:uncharacterized protein ACA1_284220 [Acanthamoeba castellanii str. Neff]|uniref:RING-type domain-containing protein n=1 Tax=Acanthamoeba castellanii (strain ATCC 30010 / Neff) TaxID=1257118 RepID=L8H6N6_ACACF|nr:uncharacterized protein ACA1_284220 [Acanthamoeba castellanii str. Neff]ELR21164.1 hypothetical protein ACA1_284220 [Acanthamoeba castellanii str. Neff]